MRGFTCGFLGAWRGKGERLVVAEEVFDAGTFEIEWGADIFPTRKHVWRVTGSGGGEQAIRGRVAKNAQKWSPRGGATVGGGRSEQVK